MFLAGVPNRHHLRPDVDGQPAAIQQHHEDPDTEQQHGGTHLAAGHHLQELQERRLPLDHHAQPAAPDMERRQDPLHPEVGHLRPSRRDLSSFLPWRVTNHCMNHACSYSGCRDYAQ